MTKLKTGRFTLIFLVFFICSCNILIPPEERGERAAESKGDIVVGAVYTSTYSNFFLEGVRMAVEEINQAGGVSGRKLKLITYDDKDDVSTGKKVAMKLARNKDVIAVVGHGTSTIAIPASVIYEKTGIAFISYGATDPDLTVYSNNYTCRNIPSQKIIGDKTAEFVSTFKPKKMVVFTEIDRNQQSLSEIFSEYAVARGTEIVATRSFFGQEKNFNSTIASLKTEYEFDSVFIASRLPAAGILVMQLRNLGVDVPIFGGDSMDSSDLWAIAGKAAQGIIVPTVFHSKYPDVQVQNFVRNFESKYGVVPDTWAAQGYDAVSLLAWAIGKTEPATPDAITTALRFLEKWKGVTGSYSFTPQGDIIDKEIFFKKMENGEFIFLHHDMEYKGDLFNYLEEQTIRLPLENPVPTIDPGLAGDTVSSEIIEQLFLGLTNFDPETYEAVPGLATRWRASSSGRTYIFYLRDDVYWTDGNPVTANDIVWAIRRNIDPELKSPKAHMLYILKNAEAVHKGEIKDVSKVGVYAPDDYTVTFALENPAVFFPTIVNSGVFRPLPRAAIEKYKDQWTAPENIQTNGSYNLALWEKGRGLFLKKNEKYYDAENVSIPEIRYYIISQPSLGLAMFKNNELDVIGSSYLRLPSPEIPRIKKDPVLRGEYSEYPHFCTYTYAFNTKRHPVDNPLVRKAISGAINRQLLIDTVNNGRGKVATTCTRPPVFGYAAPEAGTGFNYLQARKWLAEAGYPGGKGFPEITLLYYTSEFHGKIAYAIKNLLEQYLNINVKVQEEDEEAYTKLVTEGDPPHMFRVKMCADYPDANNWMKIFKPRSGKYKTNWKNQEFVQLDDEASEESDPKKRKALYKRCEQILCKEDLVAVPLYFATYQCLTKSRVKGWYHIPLGGQHIRNWYFENK
ncbi:MAG: ABC transporter substrate-binding protein [Desulfobacterales bacterium]|nr:ABC transporter substrate-binding protein [Desulfobacterales bacterium]